MLSSSTRSGRTHYAGQLLDGVFAGLWFSLALLLLFATCYPVS